MIPDAILKALGQMGDRAFLGVLLRALGLTVLLLAGFVWLTAAALGWLLPETVTLPWIGEVGFIGWLAEGVGVAAALILSVFLMVPVASVFVGLFLDAIANAVEARHYPALPPVGGVPFWVGLGDALRFLGVMSLVNLVAIVLYLLLAPLAPLIFWTVNGFLLGREYFQLVALRRLPPKDAARLRRSNFATIWAAGVLMAAALSLPVVNLIVPIIGAAVFTHLFHRLAPR